MKVSNELTPGERLRIRWLRIFGRKTSEIARIRSVSKDTVILHTTKLQVFPEKTKAGKIEQIDRLRYLLGRELGMPLDNEAGRTLFFDILEQTFGRAANGTASRSTPPDQEKPTSDENLSGHG